LAEISDRHVCLVSLVGGMGYATDQTALNRAQYATEFIPLICGEIPFAKIQHELPRELVKLARRLI
jgi:hypothetical protein